MARYIDAEMALKIIDSYAKTVSADGKVVVDAIKDIVGVITPTADVVSKEDLKDILMKKKACVPPSLPSDVVREIEVRARTETNTIKADVAREIFEEMVREVYSKIPDKILPVTFGKMSRHLDYNDGLNFGSRNAYFDTLKIIAELKKKYTEEQS